MGAGLRRSGRRGWATVALWGACAALSGCLISVDPPPDDVPPEAMLAGSWKLEQQDARVDRTLVAIDPDGEVAAITFVDDDREITYSGEALDATLILNGLQVRLTYRDVDRFTGVVLNRRYAFDGVLDESLSTSAGTGSIVERNLGGGEVREILGPASFARQAVQ